MAAQPDSPQRLQGEILAEARRQSAQIVERAEQDARLLLAKAQENAAGVRQKLLEQAAAEARRRAELILATVPVEAGRSRAARVERLLEGILQRASEELDAPDRVDYRKTIISLAVEALTQMAGERFLVRISPADEAAFGPAIVEEIARRIARASVGLTVVADPSVKRGGVIVCDSPGRQVWDNRFASRWERLWPALRPQVASQLSLLSVRAGGGSG